MKTQYGATVRQMRTPEDAAEIVDMARELALAVQDPRPPVSAESLLRDGLGPERWFDGWLAETDGRVCGYALTCRGFEAHTGKKRLWLGDLYVRESARNRGTGRALLEMLARYAIECGCDAIYWELWRQNRTGRAFYERLNAQELADLAIMRLDTTTWLATLSVPGDRG